MSGAQLRRWGRLVLGVALLCAWPWPGAALDLCMNPNGSLTIGGSDCTGMTASGAGTPAGATSTLQMNAGGGLFGAATAATFSTSLTGPLLMGGAAVGSTLTLQSTSAAGTTDSILVKTGSNGGTLAATVNGGSTIPGRWDFGTGDNAVFGGITTTAQRLYLRDGTLLAGSAIENPLIKAVRHITMAIATPNDEVTAAIHGITRGVGANQTQATGVLGEAANRDTSTTDAVGVLGYGRHSGTSGIGSGGFFAGQNDVADASVYGQGMEVQTRNYSGLASTFATGGLSRNTAIWITGFGTAGATGAVSLGIGFGKSAGAEGQQFEVGIGATTQNPFSGSFIRDLSTVPITLDIQGTHSDSAIKVAAASGNVNIGVANTAGRRVSVLNLGVAGTNTFGVFATGQATHTSSTMNVLSSIMGQSSITGNGGTTTQATGVRGNVAASATSGTVTTMASLYGVANTNSGPMTVTTNAGLYLEAQTVGTNIYQIYSAGTAASRFFGPIDLSQIAAGSSNLTITATSDTPATTWTTGATTTNPLGFIEISVGGNTRYVPFYN